jgi:peptidyl-prolyl cis-trans isomerase B (cyclophilin B)
VKIKFSFMLVLILLLTACGTGEESGTAGEQSTTGDKGAAEEQGASEGQSGDYRQLAAGNTDRDYPTVELVTSQGTITLELYSDVAPKAVENFLTHSKDGYYNGLTFHRVMNEFMIQGGDPLGTGTGGESIYGSSFEDEFSTEVYHFKGAISMANSGPNTNGSQFFIVQKSEVEKELQQQMEEAGFPEEVIKAYGEQGGTPWLDNKHTVFGQVVSGLDVVDTIASVEVDKQSKPLEPVVIEKINVIE